MNNVKIVLGSAAVFVAVIVITLLLIVGGNIFGSKVNAYVAKKTLNARITSQVFNANNATQSQAYFEQLNADVNGYADKIRLQKTLVHDNPSPYNVTNLSGLQQECINAVQQYNAAARSIASQAFRSADLPYQLSDTICS